MLEVQYRRRGKRSFAGFGNVSLLFQDVKKRNFSFG
jgi:hypothetical protein